MKEGLFNAGHVSYFMRGYCSRDNLSPLDVNCQLHKYFNSLSVDSFGTAIDMNISTSHQRDSGIYLARNVTYLVQYV